MRQSPFVDPAHSQLLASASWAPCEALIKSFEEAWRRGQEPAIGDYLHADGPQRQALLIELTHVDLEFRIKAGEPARVETYLRTFPELALHRSVVLDLLAAEYELRRLHQEVDPEEYGDRFPDLHDDLRLRLAPPVAEDRRDEPGGSPVAWPAVPGYEVLEEVGRGGMGVVFKARETSLGRHVALKFLPAEFARDPDRLERFRREARTASALNHPHICTVHALGEHAGRPYIVMEFIEGQTLQEVAGRRPPIEEAARLVRQAARALAAAHAAGVVHRDVKPENVMVRADGYVKVLDFGLARRPPALASAETARRRDTDPGALVGTLAYMSPEQAQGAPAGPASDVFSLGLVLYQLVTGRHPFQDGSSLETLHAIMTRQPAPPSQHNPEVPAALDGLTAAMLHKDARLRPTAAEVEAALDALAWRAGSVSDRSLPRSLTLPARTPIVHREPELVVLRAALADADAGRGSLVCLAGEPGIGKTTLAEDFLGEMAPDRGCLVARGRCSERLAGSEAYLPVIDALGDLLRSDTTGSAARLMKVVAPTWYARLAPEAPPATRAVSQQALLREFVVLLQEVSRLGTVVLFVDDVHWADVSTVDLLAHLGRHGRDLRLLVVVTYRPTELILGRHPFHQVRLELLGRGACTELSLGFLDRNDIDRYLALAFPGHALPADFADLVHARTEGSPLFMADLLRYLRERGVIAEKDGRWALAREVPGLLPELPGSVRSMIQHKLERLDEDDRRLLSAASVQGHEFDAVVVAEVLNRDPADVEEELQALDAVHGLVRRVREYDLPDRTLTLRFAFVHVLYQQALYADLAPSRRAALGAALARALEKHHGEQAPAVAAELGCLYEVGRDFTRAAWHFGTAAQNAARVFAHREAVVLARRGLGLLSGLPTTPERVALELPLQTTLGLQLQVTEGYAAREAREVYTRARELYGEASRSLTLPESKLFPVLWGLWLYSKVRSELSRAQERADELLALARRLNDPDLALQAHQALGVTALCRGEPAASLRHVEQATALYNPRRHRSHSGLFGQDPGVICKAFGAVSLWLLGYPEQARRQSDEAVRMSRELSPTSQVTALHFAAMVHQLRRDAARVWAGAEVSGTIAAEHGFSFWRAGALVLRGWALAGCGEPDEGVLLLRQGLVDWRATGSITYETYYLGLLAEVLTARGEVEETGRLLEEALVLVARTGEGLYEAELYRLRGEADPRRAEEDFRRAIEIARRQEARSLELRAAMSLYRLALRRGEAAPERRLLDQAYRGFTEGLETPDLADAARLLEAPA